MPSVQVDRINTRAPAPEFVVREGKLGPATGANATSRFLCRIPLSGGPVQMSGAIVVPSADVALSATPSTFSIQNMAGTVTYASGQNVAQVTAAAGLALTLTANAASIAPGTLLRLHTQNVASGEALQAVTLDYQADFKPT